MKWLGNAFQGEFGISYKYKQDVLTVIEGRFVNTLLLGGIGFILTFGLALLLEFSVCIMKISFQTGFCVRWEQSQAVFQNSGCHLY